MSAPLSGPLFHGTSHPFNKGDIIKPMDMDHAHATTDKAYADNYSTLDAERDYSRDPKSLFTYTYRVSPVDEKEMHSETEPWRNDPVKKNLRLAKDIPNIYVSKKGFKVEGIESMTAHPQIVTDNKILEKVMPFERRMRGKGKS
jgi:hypothetical protein